MKKLKKVWMLALLAAGFAMVIGCSNGSSDSANDDDPPQANVPGTPDGDPEDDYETVMEIKLEPNAPNNNQAVVTFLADDNDRVAKTGDKVTFTIVAKADSVPTVANKELKGFIVDNSEAGGWWTVLTGYANSGTVIDSTEEKTYELSFTFTADASSADPAACKLGLYIGDKESQDDTVTLKVKSFDVKFE